MTTKVITKLTNVSGDISPMTTLAFGIITPEFLRRYGAFEQLFHQNDPLCAPDMVEKMVKIDRNQLITCKQSTISLYCHKQRELMVLLRQ